MASKGTQDNGSTDSASSAQGRFIVSLPKDVGVMIDQVGQKLSAALEREAGVAFELSRAQIVQSLVRQALRENDASTVEQEAKDAADAPKVAA